MSEEAPLQFDHAEVVTPAETICANCQRPVDGEYFTLNGKMVCAPCRRGLEAYFHGPVAWSTWLRVLLRGGAAALVGTLVYFAVLKITGYELGIIAIGVGLLVGGAVRKASGGRGGWKFQAAAMALTYASIVASYMPTIYQALTSKQAHETKPHETQTAAKPTSGPAHEAPVAEPPAPARDEASFFGRHPGVALIALVGILFAFSAAAPWLAGFANFMGWIIIGIALYEAWKMNRRAPITFAGPFRVAAAPAASSQ